MKPAIKLTARQQQILDLIQQAIANTGAPPTRAEIAAEGGFGIEAIGGDVIFAAILHEDRLVVGDQLGEQRQNEQHRKETKDAPAKKMA